MGRHSKPKQGDSQGGQPIASPTETTTPKGAVGPVVQTNPDEPVHPHAKGPVGPVVVVDPTQPVDPNEV